jgi:BirA family transcriptional regulator, biotin operon repressor / biotin---[acetyl-CoA-carboxylase] ligase
MSNTAYTFNELNSVASTNNYAMALVHEALAKHGDAYFTAYQTQGKGQRGKQWLSNNGENIAISIIVEPKQLKIENQFYLSIAIALAVHQFFKKYAIDKTFVKWPNDIYWRDRKAAGILIENVITSTKPQASHGLTNTNNWKFAVVGIGININQTSFDTALQNAVSLKQITGKHYNVSDLAKELHHLVMEKVDALLPENFENILNNYNEFLYKKNQLVKMKTAGVYFETTIQSVNKEGKLLTTDIIDNAFTYGQVEWIL